MARIVIVATPKMGNVWMGCLLSTALSTPRLDLSGLSRVDSVIERLDRESAFVAHQHLEPSTCMSKWARTRGVWLVSVVRHPADAFLSLYHYVNNFAAFWADEGTLGTCPSHDMIGQPLTASKVVEFLEQHFLPFTLPLSVRWIFEQGVPFIRYEDLVAAPVHTLRQFLSAQGHPLPQSQIEAAIDACALSRVRASSKYYRAHCRDGRIGQWRKGLPPDLVERIRRQAPPGYAALGYWQHAPDRRPDST